MKCQKCSGDIITITNKCYDNIQVTTTQTYIGDLGFKYDGKDFTISYCASCGMVQHTFPLVVQNIVEPITTFEPTNAILLTLKSCLQSHDFKNCSIILNTQLSKRIAPSEYNYLLELYSTYLDSFKVIPEMPELFGWVDFLLARY
jgi:hypothetical protein